jgi:transcription elongation factor
MVKQKMQDHDEAIKTAIEKRFAFNEQVLRQSLAHQGHIITQDAEARMKAGNDELLDEMHAASEMVKRHFQDQIPVLRKQLQAEVDIVVESTEKAIVTLGQEIRVLLNQEIQSLRGEVADQFGVMRRQLQADFANVQLLLLEEFRLVRQQVKQQELSNHALLDEKMVAIKKHLGNESEGHHHSRYGPKTAGSMNRESPSLD